MIGKNPKTKTPRDEDIFVGAIEIESPEERQAYLDDVCGDEVALKQRVEVLLRRHDESEGMLDVPPPGINTTVDIPTVTETVGSAIGPYKLMEQIGEGGMGVVYVAEQEEPVRRKVALKIIKPGMDTKQVIARFEAERQALALMDHTNIARVIDAGTTETGRPYFIMELVRGIPITEYCDKNKLNTQQRLDLFITVCRAIQHAHQKGIIHRDIKPTNVLVTQIDGAAAPKVIDFGVAKAINWELTEQSVYTQASQMLGTPLYMSPEQAEMGGVDIDTRSDVYSLGVLLYELLTGTTPFDKETLKQAGYDEMRRIIREEEPPQPSDRISTLHAEALSTISAQRNIDAHRFSHQIQGELDWIVMRALEKDRTRRYESASAFAADVERYLSDEPVEACPPSAVYRLRKYARRNKGVLTTLILVALSLLIGTSVSIWQAVLAHERLAQMDEAARATDEQRDRADEQRDRAEENLRLAIKVLDDITVPLAENRLLHESELLQAESDLLQKALRFYEQIADNNKDTSYAKIEGAKAYQRVGEIKQALGLHQDAERVFNRAIDDFIKLQREFPEQTEYRQMLAACYNNLGNALQSQKKFTEAKTAYRQAVDLQQILLGEFPLNPDHQAALADSHNNLGVLLVTIGNREQARQAFSQSEKFRKTLADEFPRVPRYKYRLSAIQINLANLAREMEQSKLARTCNTLGDILRSQPNTKTEAVTWFREAGDLWEKLAAEVPTESNFQKQLAQTSNKLGIILAPQDPSAASEAYQKSLIALEAYANLDPQNASQPGSRDSFAKTHHNLGLLLTGLQPEQAEASLHAALTEFRALQADYPDSPTYRFNVASTLNALGNLTFATGRKQDAKPFFQETRDLRTELAEKYSSLPVLQNSLAWFLATCPDTEFRDPSRAVKFAQRAIQREKQKGHYYNTLGVALYRTGRWELAQKFLDASVSLNKGGDGNDWIFLAMTHWQLNNHEQAHNCYHKAAQWITDNKPHDLELKRFRIEAQQLLGIPVTAPMPKLGTTRKQHDPKNAFRRRRKTFVFISLTYHRLRLSAPLTSIREPVG